MERKLAALLAQNNILSILADCAAGMDAIFCFLFSLFFSLAKFFYSR
jgi:hypothetical protein